MKKLFLLLSATLLISQGITNSSAFAKTLNTKPVAAAKAESLMKVEHFTLPNGLQVFITPNKQSPRFYAEVAVRAGSKNDPAEATGIAHYLEHMLFKGSEDMGTMDFVKEKPLLDEIVKLYDIRFKEQDEAKRKELEKKINELSVQSSKFAVPADIDSLYSRLGGEALNAHTSFEETVYEIDLPKNRLEQWAKIESNRFAKPVFRLFQSELEAVYEEKNISMDNKDSILFDKVMAQLFKKHQYGSQTTLGTVEHLKNPSLSKMYEFYRKYYVPNNMAIFLSGDIDPAQAKTIISKYFGFWKNTPVPGFKTIKEEPIKGAETVTANYAGEESVLLAFRTAPYTSRDKDALTIIDMLLDSGEEGMIKLNLVNPQKMRGGGSYPYFLNDYGAEFMYAVLNKGQTHQQAENLLMAELEKIKKGQFDFDLVKGIILSFEMSKKSELESNTARVGIMRDAFIKGVPVSEPLSLTDRLKKVSKAEIIRVANQYFGKNYIRGYRYDKAQTFPKIAKPELEKVQLNPSIKSKFAQSVEALNPAPITPKWLDYNKEMTVKSYAPGVLLYHVKNPLNDLFNLSIDYEYGDKHYKNFCYIMDELNFAGTGNLKPEAVKNNLFKNGINVSYNCSDYGFSLGISGTDPNLEKGVALGEQVLWNAKLDEQHLKAKIENIISNREDEKKDQDVLREALKQYVRYDKRSGYLDRSTSAELNKLSVNSYQDAINQLKKQNFKIYYTGQLPIDKVEQIVKKYQQPKNITLPLLNPRKEPESLLVTRDNLPLKIYFVDYKGVQSYIGLTVPGEVVNPDKSVLTGIYNEYFGNIFYKEIRESRALAYSASSSYYQGSRLGDQDLMGGFIGTQADKTVDAIKAAIELLKNHDNSPEDFNNAKKSLENSYRTGYVNFRSVPSTIEYWADLGFSSDPRPRNFQKLNNFNFAELQNFIKNNIYPKNIIFTIVGDKDKIDMNELKKIGEVEEIPLNKLFTD
jgi:predicted Zn-dependent peptidase